jgi:hypothetical protein
VTVATTVNRPDRAMAPWPRLRFEVGSGCTGRTVELHYDCSAGAVLDLGLRRFGRLAGLVGVCTAPVRDHSGRRDARLPSVRARAWQLARGSRSHRLPVGGIDYTVTISAGRRWLLDRFRLECHIRSA